MRLNPEDLLLLVIDVQERLFGQIANNQPLHVKLPKLIQGFKLFNIPIILNEQYKKGLGNSIKEIAVEFESSFEKLSFSSYDDDPTKEAIINSNKKTVVLCGIESHICVLQTALDLLENGYEVVIVADCVGSRSQYDKKIALKRLQKSGAILTTLESILFELCRSSQNENFKAISSLIK